MIWEVSRSADDFGPSVLAIKTRVNADALARYKKFPKLPKEHPWPPDFIILNSVCVNNDGRHSVSEPAPSRHLPPPTSLHDRRTTGCNSLPRQHPNPQKCQVHHWVTKRGLFPRCDYCGEMIIFKAKVCQICQSKVHKECIPYLEPPPYVESPSGYPRSPHASSPTPSALSSHDDVASQSSGIDDGTGFFPGPGDSIQESSTPQSARSPNQTCLAQELREWSVEFSDVKLGEPLHAKTNWRRKYCQVYEGKWHGEVAVKVYECSTSAEEQMELAAIFRAELASLSKTRHDNLILFMGCCTRPPNLAIITQRCTGDTLQRRIRERHALSPMPETRGIHFASQIANGMGYLHTKEIIHCALKSQNIFLEGEKVIIADFGQLNVARLRRPIAGRYLNLERHNLCYFAPELTRNLRLFNSAEQLRFTTQTDVYAFGVVWYEILTSRRPYEKDCWEYIIWQTAHNVQPPIRRGLMSLSARALLLNCWEWDAARRPTFVQIVEKLKNFPPERLTRTESQPVQFHPPGRSNRLIP